MTSGTTDYRLSQLQMLEAESVHIFREVAAELERPVLLFSGGKDSLVMLRLAEKSFWPARIPFPLLHIDTGHNFQEVLDLRTGPSSTSGTTSPRSRSSCLHLLRTHAVGVRAERDPARQRRRGQPPCRRQRLSLLVA